MRRSLNELKARYVGRRIAWEDRPDHFTTGCVRTVARSSEPTGLDIAIIDDGRRVRLIDILIG